MLYGRKPDVYRVVFRVIGDYGLYSENGIAAAKNLHTEHYLPIDTHGSERQHFTISYAIGANPEDRDE